MSQFIPAIGLEIHVQLKTHSKLFSAAGTQFSSGENQNISPICWGYPGTLPLLNKAAVRLGMRLGLAMNCEINKASEFARKNYFYPDLPKGYQISQYDKPLCKKGWVEFISGGKRRRVTIERAHLEEDAGKSMHFGNYSLVDYNRAGMPLLEVVSAPELRSAQEAADFARMVHQLLMYLEVSDGNLEEGSMRCDCNVSVRPSENHPLGTKVEIKNLNSFRFIEKAIEYEITRQIDCLESNIPIVQETRQYDVDKNKTFAMRGKEQAHDYRYFPDPDILPVIIQPSEIDSEKAKLPELPLVKYDRFVKDYGLTDYDASLLIEDRKSAEYFEQASQHSQAPKLTANWILTELLREMKEAKVAIDNCPVSPQKLGELVQMIDKQEITGKIAKQIFSKMWQTGGSPRTLVNELGLTVISDVVTVEKLVDEVIAKSPQQFAELKAGKDKVVGYFVGQVMKMSQGKADPQIVNQILHKKRQS